MEYKLIKLNEWQRTGEGASASSYVNINDDNYVYFDCKSEALKLFRRILYKMSLKNFFIYGMFL